MSMLVIFASIIVAILAFFLSLFLVIYIRNRRGSDIFHRLRRHNVKDEEDEVETEDLLRRLYRFIKRTAQPILNWDFSQYLDLKLKQAGLPIYGGELIITALMGAAIAGIAVYMLTLSRSFAIMISVFVPIAFWAGVLFMIERRRKAFTEQLGDCLTTVANALRAGYSFQQAMGVVAEEMEPPISDEFEIVNNDVVKGISLENALEQMNRRVNSSDFELVVTAVLIQREVGGNLAQILDTISDTINERIRMKREIMSLTAQGRFSALVLLLLPFVVGVFMYFSNHDNFMLLFEDPRGQMALVVSIIMEIIGYIVIQKIVDIDT